MNLSKTDIHVLEHIRDNAGQIPVAEQGKTYTLETKRIATSRQKLLDLELLSPASKNKVVISNKGISVLAELASEEQTETPVKAVANNFLEATVYPSDVPTIAVAPDADYGGAHLYTFINSIGFKDGEAQYHDSTQNIQFVQKNEDGTMIPGIQSEQLVIALIDRHKKLNARFPSPQNEVMISCLEGFLQACKERVDDRINRNVMGNLKK